MRIQEEKIESQENVHRRICLRDVTYLVARPTSNIICCFSCLLPPFRLLRFYALFFFATISQLIV